MERVDEYGHRLKSFSLRMEKELRARLEKQARQNGRTLTSEINYRLDQSLEAEIKSKDFSSVHESLDSLHSKLDQLNGK